MSVTAIGLGSNMGNRLLNLRTALRFWAEISHGGENSLIRSDVFETEPLPPDSHLWDLPNMIITPHCTPEVPDLTANSLEIICDNIQRYRNGESLRNVLDIRDVYTKAGN